MEIEIKEMTIPELLFQFFEYKTGLDRADFDLIVVRSTGEKKKLPKSGYSGIKKVHFSNHSYWRMFFDRAAEKKRKDPNSFAEFKEENLLEILWCLEHNSDQIMQRRR